jgi:hypothetical protein
VLAEWGVPCSAHGAASLVGNELVLRGCKSYRGATVQGCDEANPPVHLKLNSSMLVQRHAEKHALRHSKWIKTDSASWQGLATKCEALSSDLAAPKQGSASGERSAAAASFELTCPAPTRIPRVMDAPAAPPAPGHYAVSITTENKMPVVNEHF